MPAVPRRARANISGSSSKPFLARLAKHETRRARTVDKASETELEPAQLAGLADATGVTWLSAKSEPVNGGFMPKRCLVLQRNGIRIGVSGVADPALVKNNVWRAREPGRGGPRIV